MNNLISTFMLVLLSMSGQAQKQSAPIITSDIKNFWEAYDKITSTQDSVLQYNYLDQLFLKKGTDGLKAIQQTRHYTPQEYINAINNYPKFWKAIRENTLKADQYSQVLETGINKLRTLYPDLKPAKIYFTVGALRTGGTTLDSLVLIGSELALADKQTPTHEFPENLSHLRNYFDSEPSQNIVFLNIHEYLHTQQKTTIGNSLLAQTVLEGVAEFVAEKALETASPNPQMAFGREHDTQIKAKFELEMFSPNIYNWIWNSPDNEFGMRDLGYYVGYKICEAYYYQAANKQQALKEMIELDYNNEAELIQFVEKSAYFDKPLAPLKKAFEKSRPQVTQVDDIPNAKAIVPTTMKLLTIHFSQEMDSRFRNFQLGRLGEENVLRIKDFQGFSEDGTAVSFGIEPLEPSKTYQIVVGSGFRNREGIPLIPYVIEFKTTEE